MIVDWTVFSFFLPSISRALVNSTMLSFVAMETVFSIEERDIEEQNDVSLCSVAMETMFLVQQREIERELV